MSGYHIDKDLHLEYQSSHLDVHSTGMLKFIPELAGQSPCLPYSPFLSSRYYPKGINETLENFYNLLCSSSNYAVVIGTEMGWILPNTLGKG